MSEYKFGRLPWSYDRRDLRMVRYTSSALAAPVMTNYRSKVAPAIGMMGNDRLGDCTCAAIGHAVQVWSGNTGKEITIPDSAIISAYNVVSGGVDRGANMRTALDYARNKGIGGHRIQAYAACEHRDLTEIEQSIYLFEGCYVGVSLPANGTDLHSWSDPNPTLPPDPYKGHAIWAIDYDRAKQLVYFATWGQIAAASYNWVRRYTEECWAVLSPDLFGAKVKSPAGFDLQTLAKDLKALAA